jgi:dTDP-4-dehydrorhamnose 3,5-epimerase-like enzyme
MNINKIDLIIKGDDRGSLIALEENHNVPFDVKRVYYIFGTKENVRRGFHAHKNLKQLAICVSGSCTFLLDDGIRKQHIELNTPTHGLLIEGLIWREMYDFSEDCVLMVLADHYYDENDYIRDYDVFLKEVKNDS